MKSLEEYKPDLLFLKVSSVFPHWVFSEEWQITSMAMKFGRLNNTQRLELKWCFVFSAESTVGIGKKRASEFGDLHYKEATLHTSILQK